MMRLWQRLVQDTSKLPMEHHATITSYRDVGIIRITGTPCTVRVRGSSYSCCSKLRCVSTTSHLVYLYESLRAVRDSESAVAGLPSHLIQYSILIPCGSDGFLEQQGLSRRSLGDAALVLHGNGIGKDSQNLITIPTGGVKRR